MTSASYVDDPEHWLNRAGSLRRDADQAKNDHARTMILALAEEYERQARRAAASIELPYRRA